MTNGDFIRNMSDEELANFLTYLRVDTIKVIARKGYFDFDEIEHTNSFYRSYLEYVKHEQS